MIEEPADDTPQGAPEWMVTFADLMSLLMTFFVLLLSFSNMEIVKFRTMAGSVKNALGMKSELALSDVPSGRSLMPHMDPHEGDGKAPEVERKKPAEDSQEETVVQTPRTQALVTRLRKLIEEAGLEGDARLRVRPTGVSLELEGDLLFDTGESTLRPEAEPALADLSRFMDTIAGAIDVEGHTDNVPIASARFPSNWELSAARAGSAVRYLTALGVEPRRLRAIGHADTLPIAKNTSAQGRQSNRRVAFLFLAGETTTLDGVDPRLENYGDIGDHRE